MRCSQQERCMGWGDAGRAAHLAGLLCCDIAHKGFAALDGSDRVQINTDDQAAHGHMLDSHLEPSSCIGTQQQRFIIRTDVQMRGNKRLKQKCAVLYAAYWHSASAHGGERRLVQQCRATNARVLAYLELHTSQAEFCCSPRNGIFGSAG